MLAKSDAMRNVKRQQEDGGRDEYDFGKEQNECNGIRCGCEVNDQRGRANCTTMSSVMVKMADR